MNIKNVMMLASCLIVAMPTTSLSFAAVPEEQESSEDKKAKDFFVSLGVFGLTSGAGYSSLYLLKSRLPAKSFDPINFWSGILVGAAALTASTSYYYSVSKKTNSPDFSLTIKI